jgi:uncharacterized protein (DUF4415 family)
MTNSEIISRALRTDDGRVLIKQPDGSYREEKSRTDWDRLARMTDEEIEETAKTDPDAPPMDEDDRWWKQRLVTGKAQVTIRLDQDLLRWLKAQGKGYQTRINAILRQYMDAHR